MLIAHITDTHVKLPGKLAYGRVDTAAMLRACVASLVALRPRPDLVVLTGDLVDLGRSEEYAFLHSLLAPLGLPLLAVPGNHDEREAMRAAFAAGAIGTEAIGPEASGVETSGAETCGTDTFLPTEGFLQFVDERFTLRIVGLDTLVPGEGRGELCAARLAWLEATLAAAPAQPTLILMHHPPFETGIGHMDRIGLSGAEDFGAIMARHPQVQAVLCGHLHRHIETLVGGRRCLTAPSPAHQVALDLRADAPSCFRMEPPGYLLHTWNGRQLVTHAVPIGDFAGPFPFFDPDGGLID